MSAKHGNLSVKANRRTRHQRHLVPYTSFIYGEAGGEVVAAFQHHVALRHDAFKGVGVEHFVDGFNFNVRVDLEAGLPRRVGFQLPDPLCVVRDLALQVRVFHYVEVSENQFADAGCG